MINLFRSLAGPEILLITETLLAEDLNLQPLLFQTQLLKLYFLTTLYVDVKEPALPPFEATKKLNFTSG